MNLIEKALLVIAILGSVFGLYFVFLKRFNLSRFLLGTLVILFGYNIFFNVLYWSKFDLKLLYLLAYTPLLCFSLYGPVFYFYIRSVVAHQKLTAKDLLHLIPVALFFITYWGYYTIPTIEEKLAITSDEEAAQYVNQIIPRIEWMYGILMLLYGFVSLNMYKNNIRHRNDLQIWLRAIHIAFFGFALPYIAFLVLVYLNQLTVEQDYFITFTMVAFMCLICYFGIQYPNLIKGKPIQKIVPLVKYRSSSLSKEQGHYLKEELLRIMNKKQPYLNNALRMDDLANLINATRGQTSQVINEHFELSFFDFVNSFRIKDAIVLMKDDSLNLTNEEIAYDVGFNNRISFYKAFKKFKGVSPKQFRDNIRSLNSSPMAS